MSSVSDGDVGDLIVIAAPSGAGKTTLVHALLERLSGLEFSVSYTTRQRRQTEEDGEDYFFVDKAEFERMRDADEFLEHALVFDHWYGTGKSYVAGRRAAGNTVLLEIDWQGARQVRKAAPEARTIFIAPPSIEELARRLRGRKTDSDQVIRRRLADSVSDLRHWDEFDYVIFNDDLETAIGQLTEVVRGEGQAHSSRLPAVRARVEQILSAAD